MNNLQKAFCEYIKYLEAQNTALNQIRELPNLPPEIKSILAETPYRDRNQSAA